MITSKENDSIKDLTTFMKNNGVQEFEAHGLKVSFWEPQRAVVPLGFSSLDPGDDPSKYTEDDLGFTRPADMDDVDDPDRKVTP